MCCSERFARNPSFQLISFTILYRFSLSYFNSNAMIVMQKASLFYHRSNHRSTPTHKTLAMDFAHDFFKSMQGIKRMDGYSKLNPLKSQKP